ncbi:MAG: J domain-containing protein [Bacteroidetes bacterium]|nr:J domain-containing protein [Bacteroidota bacterium]
MAEKNYYIILEVKSTATFDEIKSAYRALAKKYHPDKNTGNKAAEEYFKEIQQAYSVLSNPEKRRKYDLRSSYTARPQTTQRSSSPSPQYTGNAYQYAQQQAQYRQQQPREESQKRTTQQPPIKDNAESWQILVSVGIALVLLYFIISYSAEKHIQDPGPQTTTEVIKIQQELQPTIGEFDSPYSHHFGEEISDRESKNNILIMNSNSYEVVICLIENKGGRTIRNQYISKGSEFKMNEIPDGEYSLKVYFGNEWDASKTFSDISVKGGFKYDNIFAESNTGKDVLMMKKGKAGAIDSYSTYELKVSPQAAGMIKITAEEFFGN